MHEDWDDYLAEYRSDRFQGAGGEGLARDLWDFARRVARGRGLEWDEAEDIASEVIVRLHTADTRARTGAEFRGFVRTIALNLTRDGGRDRGRRRVQPLEGAVPAPDPEFGSWFRAGDRTILGIGLPDWREAVTTAVRAWIGGRKGRRRAFVLLLPESSPAPDESPWPTRERPTLDLDDAELPALREALEEDGAPVDKKACHDCLLDLQYRIERALCGLRGEEAERPQWKSPRRSIPPIQSRLNLLGLPGVESLAPRGRLVERELLARVTCRQRSVTFHGRVVNESGRGIALVPHNPDPEQETLEKMEALPVGAALEISMEGAGGTATVTGTKARAGHVFVEVRRVGGEEHPVHEPGLGVALDRELDFRPLLGG